MTSPPDDEATHNPDQTQKSNRDRTERAYQAERERNYRDVEEKSRAQTLESVKNQNEAVQAASQENATILAAQARELGSVRERFSTLGQEPFAKADEFAPDGNKFHHEKARHEQALSDQGTDIYEAQARAAGNEHALFVREQNDFTKKIEKERDLTTRNELIMQKDIRAADHLAFTSQRIAAQSVTLTGDENNQAAEHYRDEADKYERASKNTREQYRERNKAGYERSLESAENSSKDQSREQGATVSAPASPGELSDAQQAKLARLNEQFSQASAETTHRLEGPTRPTGHGNDGP